MFKNYPVTSAVRWFYQFFMYLKLFYSLSSEVLIFMNEECIYSVYECTEIVILAHLGCICLREYWDHPVFSVRIASTTFSFK